MPELTTTQGRPRLRPTPAAILLGLAAILPAAGWAQPYSVGRWTVDGGGASRAEAGPFVLFGTAGQPDAGHLPGATFSVYGGFWGPGSPSIVGVGDPPGEGPQPPGTAPVSFELRLHGAAPNPLADRTRIAFELPRDLPVEIRVHDLFGARVRTLANGTHSAGRHAIDWDTRGADGRRVGPGLYFVRVRLGTLEKSLKLVVVR